MVWRSAVLERVVSSVSRRNDRRPPATRVRGTWPGGAPWELGRQRFGLINRLCKCPANRSHPTLPMLAIYHRQWGIGGP